MTPEESQTISNTLQHLEAAYWYDVDTNQGANAHEFYTEDGIFEMGLDSKPHVGRTAVKKFYAWRRVGERVPHGISLRICRSMSEPPARRLCWAS